MIDNAERDEGERRKTRYACDRRRRVFRAEEAGNGYEKKLKLKQSLNRGKVRSETKAGRVASLVGKQSAVRSVGVLVLEVTAHRFRVCLAPLPGGLVLALLSTFEYSPMLG